MLRVKLALVFLPIFTCVAAPPDPLELLKRHRYQEAATIWENSIWDKDTKNRPLDEKGVRSLKGLAVSYYQLGSLYTRFHPFSLALLSEYYRGVLSQENSPLSLYYLGQVQYQKGRWDSAAASFDKAKKLGVPIVPEEADVFFAFATSHLKNSPKPVLVPKTNAAQWQALDLSGVQPSGIPSGLAALSPRARRCRLSILARSPSPMFSETYQALRLVLQDALSPELSQDPGRNTQIDFYDPFLLETLSRAYLCLSEWWQIRLLHEEKQFPELALKFSTTRGLAEAYLVHGNFSEALRYLGSSDNDIEVRILRAKILGKQGKLSKARELLEGVVQEAKTPIILREVAESYFFLTIDSQKALQLAAQALEDKDGSNYYRIHAALLLASGKNDAALQEYAKGYKIEFRNRIDQIDPEYMSDYSFAIFLTNKMRYEEIVETLFHLQKEIPACRQMHYAMQGISAASARNFEAQKIFRKGG